jgi:monooxygenase
MPRQGSRFPWQVHQSYLRDYRVMKLGAIEDGVLQLSSPAVEPAVVGARPATVTTEQERAS